MHRRKFIEKLGLVSLGLPILPIPIFNLSSKAIKIYDNYLRGLQYYFYKGISKKIKEGDEVQLFHHAENIHDSFAIEIRYQEQLIGYLPAYENIVVANMLDAGVKLQAFVSKHNLKEDYFSRIAVEIYTDLVVSKPKIITKSPIRADEYNDRYRNWSFD